MSGCDATHLGARHPTAAAAAGRPPAVLHQLLLLTAVLQKTAVLYCEGGQYAVTVSATPLAGILLLQLLIGLENSDKMLFCTNIKFRSFEQNNISIKD